MSSPERLVATVLLCDAVQVGGDKLHILGGGWSYMWLPEQGAPTPMGLAVHLAIPWTLANRRLNVEMRLVTEDGEQVEQPFGEVRTTGVVEAGRPAGVRVGAPLVIPIALNYPVLALDYGGYVWEVSVDGDTLARVPFQIVRPPGAEEQGGPPNETSG
jgi:hypothetical protein